MSDWNKLPVISILFGSLIFMAQRLKDVGSTIWLWVGLYMALKSVPLVVATMMSGLMIIGAFTGVLKWHFYRYRFTDEALEIHSGVISKLRVKIPLSRVLNVELTQPYIYRLGGFVSACFDSPGQSKKDGIIPLMKQSEANTWRNKLVQEKQQAATSPCIQHSDDEVLTRSVWDLFVFGMCHNRIFILFSLIAGAYYKASELIKDFDDRLLAIYESFSGGWPAEIVVIAWGLVIATLLSLTALMSGAAEVVLRFGYRLKVLKGGLSQTEGLITKKEQHIKLRKLQWISIRETLLDRISGRASILLRQLNDVMVVPALRQSELQSVVSKIRPGATIDAVLQRVSPYSPIKVIVIVGVALGYLSYMSFEVDRLWFGVFFSVVGIALILAAITRWYRFGWYFDNEKLVISTGRLDKYTHYIQWEKLQDVVVSQSVLQRMLGIMTIRFNAAGKSFTVPGVRKSDAHTAREYALKGITRYRGQWT